MTDQTHLKELLLKHLRTDLTPASFKNYKLLILQNKLLVLLEKEKAEAATDSPYQKEKLELTQGLIEVIESWSWRTVIDVISDLFCL